MSVMVVGYILWQDIVTFILYNKFILLPKTQLQLFDHIGLLKITHIMGG